MAGQLNDMTPGVTAVGEDNQLAIFHVKAGGTSSIAVLALDVTGSNGVVTTWYYWPNASGILQFSTTAPTSVSSSGTGV